jgi:proteasome lid subunit RPN8/RPN11
MRILVLSVEQQQEMMEHARQSLPDEAVGLLGGLLLGSTAEVKRVFPLPNLLGSRAFLADPYAQYQAERLLAEEDIVPLAVYHSHPGGGVQLSPTDHAFAVRRPLLQVVIALAREGLVDEMRAYQVRDDLTATEIPLFVG